MKSHEVINFSSFSALLREEESHYTIQAETLIFSALVAPFAPAVSASCGPRHSGQVNDLLSVCVCVSSFSQ